MSTAVMNISGYEQVPNRGRKAKVTPDEVWESMSDNEFHTIGEIAKSFGVTRQTIRNKMKELQADGHCLVFNRSGYVLVDETAIDDKTAEAWHDSAIWIKGSFERLVTTAKPMQKRKLVTAIRQALPQTREDRRELREFTVQLQRMIDAQTIEDDE